MEKIDRSGSLLIRHLGCEEKRLLYSFLDTYGDGCLRGARPVGPSILEVTFKDKAITKEIVEKGEWIVDGQTFEVRPADKLVKNVYLKGLPLEIPDEIIPHYLEEYGKILNIRRECYADERLGEVENGTRKVRIEVRKEVRNLIRMGEFTVRCDYGGVTKMCTRCRLPGHISSECTKQACHNCGSLEHLIAECQAGCIKCGSNQHRTLACERRTFAEVLMGLREKKENRPKEAGRAEENREKGPTSTESNKAAISANAEENIEQASQMQETEATTNEKAENLESCSLKNEDKPTKEKRKLDSWSETGASTESDASHSTMSKSESKTSTPKKSKKKQKKPKNGKLSVENFEMEKSPQRMRAAFLDEFENILEGVRANEEMLKNGAISEENHSAWKTTYRQQSLELRANYAKKGLQDTREVDDLLRDYY